jgi:hypothetical protein
MSSPETRRTSRRTPSVNIVRSDIQKTLNAIYTNASDLDESGGDSGGDKVTLVVYCNSNPNGYQILWIRI